MKQPTFQARFLLPRYWGVWLAVLVMRLVVLLPYTIQLGIGRWLGRLLLRFAPYRRHITEVNLQLCFPDLSAQEHSTLLQQCFESAGMGAMETAMAWWMSDRRVKKLSHFDGAEKLPTIFQQAEGRGLIVYGAHFTCLEMAGRVSAQHYKVNLMYRAHKNPVFNYIMHKRRQTYVHQVIDRKDLRNMLRSLDNNIPLWYAPDQDYGSHHSIFAPFFGQPAASVALLSRFKRLRHALVMPVYSYRLPNNKGYKIVVADILENFPTEDAVADATRWNQLLEQAILQHPEQYLWQHRRFKTRPEGMAKVYKKKREL